jgi:hypothetical protein
MQRGVLAAILASGVAGAAVAAPPTLTDAALDGVTAGGPSQPASGDPPVVIVADGATYVFDGEQNVLMEDKAQQGLRALNVVAASGSDVGNAVNVQSGAIDGFGAASQLNQLQQRESATGSLGRASLDGVSSTRRTAAESQLSSGNSSRQVTTQRLQSRSRTSTVDQIAAFVPSRDLAENRTLEVATPQLDPVHSGGISVDFLNDDGLFGIEGSIGPFTVKAPQLVLGTVTLVGDDVVLSTGHVVLPGFELGEATVTVCFAICAQDSIRLGSFGERTVALPDADLRFEGANPFKDTDINAGGGIAIVGAGSISAAPSHITLAGELTLDLPDPTFSFDFTIPSLFDDPDLIGPFEVDGPNVTIEIPAITVSHTFIDEDIGGGFSGTFDGFLCVPDGAMDCGSGSRRTEHQEARVDAQFFAASNSSYSNASSTTSGDEAVYAGASLADAEADLIAMSQASAQITAENTVKLSDSSQQGLRAANAVNAADTIVGNALNVTTLRPAGRQRGSLVGSIGQSNVFLQNRTSYGQ